MPDTGLQKKQLLVEGKTKQIWAVDAKRVLIISKDRITAGDGARANDMADKSKISTRTATNIFEILNRAGIRTAYLQDYDEKSFLAIKCEMVPIEWVARRLATGSYLRRYPSVAEGTRFYPTKIETFFKDDANHDPQWTEEQIIAAQFRRAGVQIGATEVDIMRNTTKAIFEILERYWSTLGCSLIDMKIEFGFSTADGELMLADVIDNDSWRLWPSGDKRLMKDKQVYRNLVEVKESDMCTIKENFQWVEERTTILKRKLPNDSLVVIVMGSKSDEEFCSKITQCCSELNLPNVMRISSAHKSTEDVLKIIGEYDACGRHVVYIAVAGRSNGLGLVIAGNSVSPVINCPPNGASESISRDIWSSLNLPSGIGCGTVIYPGAAALAAAHILGNANCCIWARVRSKQLENWVNLKRSDNSYFQGKESQV